MDKKMMQAVGSVMVIAGLLLLFSSVRVTSFSFGNSKWTGIIMMLIALDFILIMVKPNKIFLVIMAVLALALVAVIFLNLRMFMRSISFFKWIGILLLAAGGAGLVIKSKT